MDRRKFLQGAAAMFCAPAIVSSVMPIWTPPKSPILLGYDPASGDDLTAIWTATDTPGGYMYSEELGIQLRAILENPSPEFERARLEGWKAGWNWRTYSEPS